MTKHGYWLAGAVAGLALGCGTEGSLASSGSDDWTYPGMGGSSQNGAGGSKSSSGGGSGDTGGSSGAASGGTTGGSGATDAGGSPDVGGTGGGSGGAGASGGNEPMTGGSSSSGGIGTGGSSGAGGGAGSAGSGGTGGSSGTGTIDPSLYHQLVNWVEPQAENPNHHGRAYFLGNAHLDENGVECTACHGKNYEGDTGPACTDCHSEWRSDCSFCHGTSATASNPPRGVFDETSTGTLAVGRHAAHLASSDSHQAFECGICHTIPPDEDVEHTLEFKPSTDLTTPGHHGDVTLDASLAGMSFDVEATSGSPVSARATCIGACHSNGLGGTPVKTPYWAGGAWTSGCGNCHRTPPDTGHHEHAIDEGDSDCSDCHAGATGSSYSAGTHFNGTIDYLGTVQGEGMTLKADSTCSSGVRCNGTCHGNDEGHNNKCW